MSDVSLRLCFMCPKERKISCKKTVSRLHNVMAEFEQECKLCDEIISDENFKVIEDVIKSFCDFLLLKLTLHSNIQNVMCKACFSKLLSALNFKSTCIQTDHTLISYADFENPTLVDFKEVYAKEKAEKQQGREFDNREKCRLCLGPISGDLKSIQEVPVETIETYIPEINFTLTTNPVICIKCHDELYEHSSFLKNCLEVEKRRNMVAMDADVLLTNPCIKTEEVDIKDEQIDDDTVSQLLCIQKQENEEGDTFLHSQNDLVDTEENKSLYDPDDLKPTDAESTSASYERKERTRKTTSGSPLAGHDSRPENDSEVLDKRDGTNTKTECQFSCKTHLKSIKKGSKVGKYRCDKCIYNTNNRSHFTQHLLLHKDRSEVEMYGCEDCDYKSLHKGNLKKHKLTHKDPSVVRMHQCGECDYKSLEKGGLTKHQLTHKDPSVVQTYRCEECDYKSIQKDNLKKHQLKHKNPSDLQTYGCTECAYKTIRKSDLKKHVLTHKHLSQVQTYQCDECDFKSIRKVNLNRHRLQHVSIHEDLSVVQMHQCDECDYKSVHKANLRNHKLRHKHPSEVPMHRCEECGYVCREKGNLRKHKLKHKDPSEVQKYRCNECGYESIRKASLKTHLLTHKDCSELQTYRCNECDYNTIRKGDLKQHLLTRKCKRASAMNAILKASEKI